MKLEGMKKSLIEMEHEERYAFLLSYFETRNREIQEVQVKMSTRASGPRKKKEKLVTVSSNQLTLLKQLGLI